MMIPKSIIVKYSGFDERGLYYNNTLEFRRSFYSGHEEIDVWSTILYKNYHLGKKGRNNK